MEDESGKVEKQSSTKQQKTFGRCARGVRVNCFVNEIIHDYICHKRSNWRTHNN